TKQGNGNLTLSGNNTYSGVTTVSAGRLIATGGSAIGDSSTVNIAGGATFEVASSETIGALSGFGSTPLDAGVVLTTGHNGADTTYSGNISGSGNLTKVGTGNFTLNGTSVYSGATTVVAGDLFVNGNLASPTVSVQSGARARRNRQPGRCGDHRQRRRADRPGRFGADDGLPGAQPDLEHQCDPGRAEHGGPLSGQRRPDPRRQSQHHRRRRLRCGNLSDHQLYRGPDRQRPEHRNRAGRQSDGADLDRQPGESDLHRSHPGIDRVLERDHNQPDGDRGRRRGNLDDRSDQLDHCFRQP